MDEAFWSNITPCIHFDALIEGSIKRKKRCLLDILPVRSIYQEYYPRSLQLWDRVQIIGI